MNKPFDWRLELCRVYVAVELRKVSRKDDGCTSFGVQWCKAARAV
jgi:hypothetical protein